MRDTSKPRDPKFKVGDVVLFEEYGKKAVVKEVWWDGVDNRYEIEVRSRDISKGTWTVREDCLGSVK